MQAPALLDRLHVAVRKTPPLGLAANDVEAFVHRKRAVLLALIAEREPDLWTSAKRTKANLAAMEVLARGATSAEVRRLLARYSGWGGLSLRPSVRAWGLRRLGDLGGVLSRQLLRFRRWGTQNCPANMHAQHIPRFGRVRFSNLHGLSGIGTTIWFDRIYGRHVVSMDGEYRCVEEKDLTFTGGTVGEGTFLGTKNEISFDTVGPGGGRHSEGCLRRRGRFWECFFVRPVEWEEGTPRLPRLRTNAWGESRITGHLVEVEHGFVCTHAAVMRLLAELFELEDFEAVRGPDSLWLK